MVKKKEEKGKYNKLFLEKKSAWELLEKQTKKAFALGEEYKDFLDNNKTEREIVTFVEKTVKYLEIERECFSAKFDGVRDIKLFPSRTSFILAKLYGTHTSKSVCENLARSKKILLRDCFNFNGLSEHFIRISLKTREENNNLAEALMELFK